MGQKVERKSKLDTDIDRGISNIIISKFIDKRWRERETDRQTVRGSEDER